jgi:glycosyltransferase involved in cell wall biosynthesis
MPVAAHLFAPPPPGARRSGVLFVGRLTRQKGVHDLLRAAVLAPPAPLTVVGSGPEESGLRALAAELGLAERITWLPTQPQERLASLYREAQLVAVPSHEEGLGLVAVEAGLCGAPVVGYASGGLPDVVEDGTSGVLVPAGDVPALARAIGLVLGDPERAARLGAGGAERGTRFTPEAAAARYHAIYLEVLAARRSRPPRDTGDPGP